jgi:hypothetical protein
MSWTEEKVDTLRRMHTEGASFALISDATGMSRNSCIGKARRLDLQMRVTVKTKIGEPKPKGQKRPYIRVVRAAGNTSTLKIIETVETDLPQFSCDVVPLNKTLDEIASGCRYITGDPLADGPGLYCGHPVHKRSYCAEHFARCYVEPQKRWGAQRDQALSRKNPDSIHRKMVSVDSGEVLLPDRVQINLGLASETEPA